MVFAALGHIEGQLSATTTACHLEAGLLLPLCIDDRPYSSWKTANTSILLYRIEEALAVVMNIDLRAYRTANYTGRCQSSDWVPSPITRLKIVGTAFIDENCGDYSLAIQFDLTPSFLFSRAACEAKVQFSGSVNSSLIESATFLLIHGLKSLLLPITIVYS